MKILFIGDIFGNPGRKAVKELLPKIKSEYNIDLVIANGENSAGGSGITYVIAQELYKLGIDIITLGNHTWSKKEVLNFIDDDIKIIRPCNFPSDLPGRGSCLTNVKGLKVGIINIQGRVYLEGTNCPFRAADEEIMKLKKDTNIIIVDFHAEATSEKAALAWYLDGRVSAVLGTHTHVQTADARILDCGTGFITDAGMTGPHEGIIGVEKEIIIQRFFNNMPARHEVSKGKIQFNAVVLEIEEKKGRTIKIETIYSLLDS